MAPSCIQRRIASAWFFIFQSSAAAVLSVSVVEVIYDLSLIVSVVHVFSRTASHPLWRNSQVRRGIQNTASLCFASKATSFSDVVYFPSSVWHKQRVDNKVVLRITSLPLRMVHDFVISNLASLISTSYVKENQANAFHLKLTLRTAFHISIAVIKSLN